MKDQKLQDSPPPGDDVLQAALARDPHQCHPGPFVTEACRYPRWDELSKDYQLDLSNSLSISEAVISRIPPCPGAYNGKGIIICAGGKSYFTNAWVCINMLRGLNSRIPVQLWHLGPREIDDTMRSLVKKFNVECVDALRLREEFPCRILNGWELKPYSIVYSPFKEVLLLDADNLPLIDPELLFECKEYQTTGAVFWPDYGRLTRWSEIWRICGVRFRDEPEFETGQILVHKEKCWRALLLTLWYNAFSDFYYQYVLGDKETFHMAFRKLKQPYEMPHREIESLGSTMCQHDFQGNRIFQHRNMDKWNFNKDNRHEEGFLYEDECRTFIADLRKQWSGKINCQE